MKTQIVQLEPHDDYISVRDRMGWGQTTRVLLVWPLRGDILHRRLDLTLIKRHSIALGSQLALVTRDRDVRYQADRLDIPVYKSVREAEQSRWRRPRKRRKSKKTSPIPITKSDKRKKPDLAAMRAQAHPATPPWLNHPVLRISLFTLGVLSMLVVAAVFIPSAEIYVTPANQIKTVTIDVSASPDHKTVELSGAVPAYVRSIVVEGRGQTPSSGRTHIPRQTATGNVTFINLTEERIRVPVGTIVSTQDDPPIRFATTREMLIPNNAEGASIPVKAVQPGGSGNVGPGKIIAIEGSLGLNLSVTNRQRITGGTNFVAATPSDDDFQRVYEQLILSLQDTAQAEFEFNAAPGDTQLSTSPIYQEALEQNYTPETGEPADYLEMSLRAEFQFPYAAGADLYHLGRIVLDRHISEDFTPRPETLAIKPLTNPSSPTDGKTEWRMQASWQMGANLNETEAVSIILGLTPEQALLALNEQMQIESDTEIRMTPAWWPRLPLLPFRITLINLLDTAPLENPSTSFFQGGAEK